MPLIFFCDVSAEAHRLTTRLRERGYDVVEVPVTMLVGRVRVQMPDLILCDVDEKGALDAAHRLRDVPGGSGVDVVFIGDPGKTEETQRDAIEHEASGLFLRPVDGHALIGKVEALIGPGPGPGSHRPPQTGPRPSRLPLAPDSSVPPPEMLAPFGADPAMRSATLESEPPLSNSEAESEVEPATVLSDAVTDLLERAEARIGNAGDADRPSPQDEVQAVLPDELLRSLDETLDADAEAEDGECGGAPPRTEGVGTDTGNRATGTSVTGEDSASWNTDRETRQTAVTGGRAESTDTAEPPPAEPRPAEPSIAEAAPSEPHGLEQSSAERASTGAVEHPSTVPPGPRRGRAPGPSPAAEPANSSEHEGGPNPSPFESPFSGALQDDEPPASISPAQIGNVGGPAGAAPTWAGPSSATVGPGDVPREFGRAVRERFSGALAIESQESIRRAVLHDGDVVTVVSSAESESLVSFLVARGSLREEVGDALRRRIPRFGRHAIAALIANGHLAQDQLWPVLRAHADWLLTRVLRVEVGVISIESDVPAALASEPSVFGGGTGAEALIDGVLRAFSPAEATARLGGVHATFEPGTASFLVNECGLDSAQRANVDAVEAGRAPRLGGTAGRDAPLLYALTLLGVTQISRGRGRATAGVQAERRTVAQDSVALDAAAIRERIAARLALVREGDYYAVLGVARGVTDHEIRLAHDRLRHELDPTRNITGRTADLTDDLDLILEVVDEAYEVLNDPARRDRYLAAIEATPAVR